MVNESAPIILYISKLSETKESDYRIYKRDVGCRLILCHT